MDKKGVTTSVMIGWLIGILAVFAVMVVFLAPEQIFSKTRDAAFAFGLGALPGEAAPEFESVVPTPSALKTEFDRLTLEINNAKADACLVYITELSALNEDWFITLEENKAKLLRVSERGGESTPRDETDLANFKPCIIKGDLAQKFYDCYLRNDKLCSAFNEATLEDENKKNILLDKNSKYKYLFKKGAGNFFCSFLFYDDGDSDCNAPADKGKGLAIDSDCKAKMPSFDANLQQCDIEPSALIVKIDTEHEQTEVWDFRLTNDKNAVVGENTFSLANFDYEIDDKKTCAVFAVEEGDEDDNAQVWYVKPGSLIEKRDVGRLSDGFNGNYEHDCVPCAGGKTGKVCVSKCGNKYKASPDPKDAKDEFILPEGGKKRSTIGGEWYTSLKNDKCSDRCSLLEGAQGQKSWKPKHEILCGDDGKWKLCNSAKEGKTATATPDHSALTYTCSSDKWVSSLAKKPIETRILHVKIDPGDNPVEKWAFYLTEDEALPMDKDDVDLSQRDFQDTKSSTKACNVYSVNEEGGDKDHLSTWYISPGGRIKTSGNMFAGIATNILGVKQDSGKKRGSPYLADEESVGRTSYSGSTDHDECGHDNHPCNLLEKDADNKHKFTPKYELLCDDNGYWRVCEGYVNGKQIIASSTTYTCQQLGSKWVWR